MNNNSLIWTKSQCVEAFDDLLIKIALSSFAELEGRELLKENERLKKEPEFQLPKDAEKEIRSIIFQQRFRKSINAFSKVAYRAASKVALVFLAVAIVFSGTMAVSAEFRKTIYKLIFTDEVRYTLVELDKNTEFEFVGSEAYTWDHAFAPTMMPKGYKVTQADYLTTMSLVVYENDDGRYLTLLQTDAASEVTMQINTENAQLVQTIDIGDSEGLLVQKNGITQVVWRVGAVMLKIESDEQMDIVIEVAKNVKLLR